MASQVFSEEDTVMAAEEPEVPAAVGASAGASNEAAAGDSAGASNEASAGAGTGEEAAASGAGGVPASEGITTQHARNWTESVREWLQQCSLHLSHLEVRACLEKLLRGRSPFWQPFGGVLHTSKCGLGVPDE